MLAYVILFMGFITFLAGAFGVLMLLFEDLAKTGRVPFRYYAMMVGLISGGLGMIGIGQGLRLLLLILGKDSRHWDNSKNPTAPAVKREAEEDWSR